MRWLPALIVCLWTAQAAAFDVVGQIRNSTGGVASEVRLWARTGKWFSSTTTNAQVITTGSGSFTFTGVVNGDYLVDCRPSGNYAERWYDSDGNGYAPGDADIIEVNGANVNGIDIVVEPAGGADGTVSNPGGLAAGLQVRIEQTSDPRIHHNQDSMAAPHQGVYAFRGMAPNTNYRIVVHDPSAVLADQVTISAFMVTTGANAAVGPLTLSNAPTDPHEGNNTRAAGTSFTVTRTVPFNSQVNSRIFPLGDVDWYCTNAAAGDRYIANAVGNLDVESNNFHESPWVDPFMSVWQQNDAGTFLKLREDDDSGPQVMDALIDTGELARAGRLCFGVTTYGDIGFNGNNQGSAGDYKLNIQYGNRGPTVTATIGGNPLPSMMTIDEGDLLQIDLTFSDPEGTVLTGSWNMVGASNAVATAGTFVTGTGMSTFLWRAPQTAAKDSPYVLTIRFADQEITRTFVVTVVVNAVNVAPTVPFQLSPIDGGHLTSQTPPLVCRESTDEDEETLTYQYEVYYEDAGTAAQANDVVGRDGGWRLDAGPQPATVAFTPAPIPENTHVRWRARAYDGHPANGFSPWSPYGLFVVDSANDPPASPVLMKPDDGEVVLVRRPTLSVVPGIDPEGDAYSLYYEVAKNPSFTMSVSTSGPTAVAPGPTTMWTVDVDLDWGGQYYARAWAIDVRNGRSGYSLVNAFKVRDNMPPSVPAFLSPDSSTCLSGFIPSAPGHVLIGPALDSEADPISIQLRVFAASDDPFTATPLFDDTRAQTPTSTEFDVSAVTLPRDVKHRFQARSVDMFGNSAWSECLFTVGEMPMGTGGGSGGTGGTGGEGGGSGGGGGSTRGGCHCGSGEGLFAALALALIARRSAAGRARRRESR